MKELKLEQAFNELEEVVQQLEKGELPLDDLIDRYEKGMRLIRLCASKLQEAEKKVKRLIKNKDGTFQTELFQ